VIHISRAPNLALICTDLVSNGLAPLHDANCRLRGIVDCPPIETATLLYNADGLTVLATDDCLRTAPSGLVSESTEGNLFLFGRDLLSC
jgi:hypothetical protein